MEYQSWAKQKQILSRNLREEEAEIIEKHLPGWATAYNNFIIMIGGEEEDVIPNKVAEIVMRKLTKAMIRKEPDFCVFQIAVWVSKLPNFFSEIKEKIFVALMTDHVGYKIDSMREVFVIVESFLEAQKASKKQDSRRRPVIVNSEKPVEKIEEISIDETHEKKEENLCHELSSVSLQEEEEIGQQSSHLRVTPFDMREQIMSLPASSRHKSFMLSPGRLLRLPNEELLLTITAMTAEFENLPDAQQDFLEMIIPGIKVRGGLFHRELSEDGITLKFFKEGEHLLFRENQGFKYFGPKDWSHIFVSDHDSKKTKAGGALMSALTSHKHDSAKKRKKQRQKLADKAAELLWSDFYKDRSLNCLGMSGSKNLPRTLMEELSSQESSS